MTIRGLVVVGILAVLSLGLRWSYAPGLTPMYLPGTTIYNHTTVGGGFNPATGLYDPGYPTLDIQTTPGLVLPGSPGFTAAGFESDARVLVPLVLAGLVVAHRRRSRALGQAASAAMVVVLVRSGVTGGWEPGTLMFAVAAALALATTWPPARMPSATAV